MHRVEPVIERVKVERAAPALAMLCAVALAASGIVGLALFVLAPDTIQGWILRMQRNLPEPYFSLRQIAEIQGRAAVAGVAILRRPLAWLSTVPG